MRLLFWRRSEDEVVCQELVELATEYLEVSLPRRRRKAVQHHLAKCGACREYLDQLQAVVRLGREAAGPPPEPSAAVMDELLRLFRESPPA